MENQSTNPKQTLLEKLQDSTNILVTVSRDPSIDQLAACLGLTIWLNKIDKHATAVFSGDVPSTLEFLKPEETLEKTTDSLRDFIIALDKSKADKLRYKVEDSVVKIFITPYRTSLSADDLEFSQGDFNVDMVIALGVTNQEDIDNAVTAHGRILHDATVATVNVADHSELGTINWFDDQSSSLSELIVELGSGLDKGKLDSQIATALLTGVVAETERFSNEKTTPQTMSVSAQLMSAGANQQLVASKLEEPAPEPEPVIELSPETKSEAELDDEPKDTPRPDGTLEIDHEKDILAAAEAITTTETPEAASLPAPVDETPTPEAEPELPQSEETSETPVDDSGNTRGNKMITEAPALGGTLTANSTPEDETLEPFVDPLTLPTTETPPAIMGHEGQRLADPSDEEASTDVVTTPEVEAPAESQTEVQTTPQPAPPDWMPQQPWMNPPAAPETPAEPATPAPSDTLEDIERSVRSPHIESDAPDSPDLGDARDEVMKAINEAPAPVIIEPEAPPAPEVPVDTMAFDPSKFEIAGDAEALMQQLASAPVDPNAPVSPELTGPIEQPYTMPLPGSTAPVPSQTPPTSSDNDPTAPPPVPPPLMPPGFPSAQ